MSFLATLPDLSTTQVVLLVAACVVFWAAMKIHLAGIRLRGLGEGEGDTSLGLPRWQVAGARRTWVGTLLWAALLILLAAAFSL